MWGTIWGDKTVVQKKGCFLTMVFELNSWRAPGEPRRAQEKLRELKKAQGRQQKSALHLVCAFNHFRCASFLASALAL